MARIKRMDDMLYDDKPAGLIYADRYKEKYGLFAGELKHWKGSTVSVTYTKLAQAIALNSGQTKEILGYAK